jgi:hypothetical protein
VSSNAANDQIAVKRPLGSLVGFVNISSIIFQIILVAAFQILGFVYLTYQNWYFFILYYLYLEFEIIKSSQGLFRYRQIKNILKKMIIQWKQLLYS